LFKNVVLKISMRLFLGLYMTHKISKKTSKHKIAVDIANFFNKPIHRIKTALKLQHLSTEIAVVAVSNQKTATQEAK
jgi:hypothetical protein